MDWSRKQIISYATYLHRAFFQKGFFNKKSQTTTTGKVTNCQKCTNYILHTSFGYRILLVFCPENSKEVDNARKIINKMVA